MCGELALHIDEALYKRLVLLVHLVIALRHRAAYDERCTGIVYEDRVDLIDNGVVMATLHEVGWREGHIVAQIVKTELIVRTECDICHICLAARIRVRLVLVDTVDTKAMELIERTHPL